MRMNVTRSAPCILATSLFLASSSYASGGYCIPNESLEALSAIVPAESAESGAKATLRDSKGTTLIVRVGLIYCSDSRQKWEVFAIKQDSVSLQCAARDTIVTIPVGGAARLTGCLDEARE